MIHFIRIRKLKILKDTPLKNFQKNARFPYHISITSLVLNIPNFDIAIALTKSD